MFYMTSYYEAKKHYVLIYISNYTHSNRHKSGEKCPDITTPWRLQCPSSCEYVPVRWACDVTCIDGTTACNEGFLKDTSF